MVDIAKVTSGYYYCLLPCGDKIGRGDDVILHINAFIYVVCNIKTNWECTILQSSVHLYFDSIYEKVSFDYDRLLRVISRHYSLLLLRSAINVLSLMNEKLFSCWDCYAVPKCIAVIKCRFSVWCKDISFKMPRFFPQNFIKYNNRRIIEPSLQKKWWISV